MGFTAREWFLAILLAMYVLVMAMVIIFGLAMIGAIADILP